MFLVRNWEFSEAIEPEKTMGQGELLLLRPVALAVGSQRSAGSDWFDLTLRSKDTCALEIWKSPGDAIGLGVPCGTQPGKRWHNELERSTIFNG